MRRIRRGGRRNKGQSLVEVMVGLIILVPIGLAALDLVVFTQATQANEQLAETAARAAASAGSQSGAQQNAQDVMQRFQPSSIMPSAEISSVQFNTGTQMVTVTTTMQVQVPVPMPFLSNVTCTANSVQPILSTPAAR